MGRRLRSPSPGSWYPSRRRYRVRYERDTEERVWIVHVPSVKGCHSYGRTLSEARRRIREALGLFVKNAATAKLVDDVALPAGAKRMVRELRRVRRQAEDVTARAVRTQKQAVKHLSRLGISLRDVGEMVGVSRQRTHQLLRRRQERIRRFRGKLNWQGESEAMRTDRG